MTAEGEPKPANDQDGFCHGAVIPCLSLYHPNMQCSAACAGPIPTPWWRRGRDELVS